MYSQSSCVWECTPPESPGIDKDLSLQPSCLVCLGEPSRHNHDFHPLGFVKSDVFRNANLISNDPDLTLSLFGHDFRFWNALEEQCDALFNLCRKSFMLLDEKRIRSISSGTRFRPQRTQDGGKTCPELRYEVHSFFNYILLFTNKCSQIFEDQERLRVLLENIQSELESLRLFFHRLSFTSLKHFHLAQFGSVQGNENTSPIYNIIHGHLEARYLHLLILQQIKNFNLESTFATQSLFNQDLTNLDEYILLFMTELMAISISKFETLDTEDVRLRSPFSCTCVKELWFLMIHFLGSERFWEYFNRTLRKVTESVRPSDVPQDCSKIQGTDYLKCSNSAKFSLWMILNVAKLYEYDEKGNHVRNNPSIEPNFSMLDETVKKFLNSDPPEASLRIYVPIIHSIVTFWGNEKNESVILLWEFYSKKMNSLFHVSSNSLGTITIECKTAAQLLKRTQSRLDPTHQDGSVENSYHKFIRFLGMHLRQCKLNNNLMLCNRLLGRIFIKFPERNLMKILELNELGVVNVASLFLTIALVGDLEETVEKLVNLMLPLFKQRQKPIRRTAAWKSVTACMLLLAEFDRSLGKAAEVLIKEVDAALTNNDVTDMPIFIDGIKHLIEKENPKICELIGIWVEKYLHHCPVRKCPEFFGLWNQLLTKVRSGALGKKGTRPWTSAEMNTLVRKLVNQILPLLPKHLKVEAAETAAAFSALFSALQINKSELISLYQFWTKQKNLRLVARYFDTLFEEDYKLEVIKNSFPEYHLDLIKCWIKSSLICDMSSETTLLTKIVFDLPVIQVFFYENNFSFNDYKDGLSDFIHLFGIAYTRCKNLEEKGKLREKFNLYFMRFEELITLDKKDKDDIDKIYQYCGLIIAHCPNFTYTRSNPASLLSTLLPKLLVHHDTFKENYVLPPAISEAIHKHLPLYVRGLVSLGPASDTYIGRMLRTIVSKYFPKLPSYKSGDRRRHPYYECLVDDKAAPFVIEILAKEFLVIKAGTTSIECCYIIEMMEDALTTSVREVFFRKVIDNLLHLIIHGNSSTKEKAMAFLGKSSEYQDLWKYVPPALISSFKSNLTSVSPAMWFKGIAQLADIMPKQVQEILPDLEIAVKNHEANKGIPQAARQQIRSMYERWKSHLPNG